MRSATISVAIIAITIARLGMVDLPDNTGLADAIRTTAGRIGVDPVDLATVFSYETAGTMDPWKRGPTTQWGEHRGLIQWGEPQRKQYGVSQDTPIGQQVEAVGRYLVDRGLKPGAGILDIYSTVNAGRPGLYNASDANNGGAPGTVRDKVATMAPHRVRASLLLDGQLPASMRSAGGQSAAVAAVPSPAVGNAPMSLSPGGAAAVGGGENPAVDSMAPLIDAARKIAAEAGMPDERMAAPQLDLMGALSQHIARAQALARGGGDAMRANDFMRLR